MDQIEAPVRHDENMLETEAVTPAAAAHLARGATASCASPGPRLGLVPDGTLDHTIATYVLQRLEKTITQDSNQPLRLQS